MVPISVRRGAVAVAAALGGARRIHRPGRASPHRVGRHRGARVPLRLARCQEHHCAVLWRGRLHGLDRTRADDDRFRPCPDGRTISTSLTVPATGKQNVAVELSATVSPNPGGGSVEFYDGDQLIGEPVTVGVDGIARMPHAFATTGDHQVTAVFNGRNGFTTSTSASSTVTVTENSGGSEGAGSLGSLSGFGS